MSVDLLGGRNFMASRVNINLGTIPLTKRAREQLAAERRAKTADEEARQALLMHIKGQSPELFEDLGFSADTSLRTIQTGLGLAKTLGEMSEMEAFEQFRQGQAPGGTEAPNPLATVSPEALVRAADILGVPPEAQQSIAPPGQLARIDPRGQGIIPADAPPGLAQQGLEQIQKANINVLEAGEKEAIKTKQEVKASQLSSQFNLNLVVENMYDLGTLLVDAYKEGGAGNILNKGKTLLAMQGVGPASVTEMFRASSTIPGKRIEIISKIFPTLTEQIGKAGSVRLIESVFNRLGQSLPDLQTPPALALDQMDATIQTMYRVNRALESIDLEEFDLTTLPGEANFHERVFREAAELRIEGSEKDALEALKDAALAPIREYMNERDANKPSSDKRERLKAIRKRIEQLRNK